MNARPWLHLALGISDPVLLQPIYDQAVRVPSKPYRSLDKSGYIDGLHHRHP